MCCEIFEALSSKCRDLRNTCEQFSVLALCLFFSGFTLSETWKQSESDLGTMTSKEEKNGRKGSTGCISSSSSQVTASCCSAVTIRKNYSHSSRSPHNSFSSSVIKKNKMTHQTPPPLPTSQNHEGRTKRRKCIESSTRLLFLSLLKIADNFISELHSYYCHFLDSEVEIETRECLNTASTTGWGAEILLEKPQTSKLQNN